MTPIAITQQSFTKGEHTTTYLSAGPTDGPLIIFTHGWPELSLSWRHQLPFFAALGFHAVAPDMRGYGGSTTYNTHDAYRQELAVGDMINLLDHLGGERAVWVGHDWGAPVAWNIASHHPDRCHGVAGLCVPFATLERGLDYVISLVDRSVYPEDQFPAGQWEYMRYYEESFAEATAPMDANPGAMIQAIFRKGSPEGMGQPSGTAMVRQQGGWFAGLSEAPEVPRDEDVISEEDLAVYTEGLVRNGFFGPNSWYMNHEANGEYFGRSANNGRLSMPTLFLAARYDYTCEAVTSMMPEPMRERCDNLSEAIIDSGHWMAQENPVQLNRELARWVFAQLPHLTE